MKAEDPFWADNKDYCEALRNQISELWNPGQFMDVNEQIIPLKGRQKCRNYNPKKANKWHFKVWCLNDSETGYISDGLCTENASRINIPNNRVLSGTFFVCGIRNNELEILCS